MKRRPNQVASTDPVSSSNSAIVRWIRRRNDGSTRTSTTLDPGADDGPLLDEPELAELAHLAQVVVAPRQVEEQLADGQEAEPAAGPLEEVGGAEAGPVEHRVEQLGRIGRAAAAAGAAPSRLRRAARGRAEAVARPGHSPTRPRSGSGSGAGRRGRPRPRLDAEVLADPAGDRLGLGEGRVRRRSRA